MKPIHTYQSLGRLIIDTVYYELSKNNGYITHRQLKDAIYKKCIKQNLFVDKSFATHKYNHGSEPTFFSHTYRWENVMSFYINQQTKANLLKTITRYKEGDKVNYISLTPQALSLLSNGINPLACANLNPFNLAREIIKQKYEDQKRTR